MIVYDVEVLRGPDEVVDRWENPEGMGFGTAVAYEPDQDRYFFFDQHQLHELVNLLRVKGPVISFNGLKFDNRVLLGNEAGWKPPWKNIDLLQHTICSKWGVTTVKGGEEKYGSERIHDGTMGLDATCKATFGQGKSGHGAKAPLLIRSGQWAAVFQYNLHDVQLTWKLYRFGKKYGYVLDGDSKRINVNW
jgi:hypothetical protein